MGIQKLEIKLYTHVFIRAHTGPHIRMQRGPRPGSWPPAPGPAQAEGTESQARQTLRLASHQIQGLLTTSTLKFIFGGFQKTHGNATTQLENVIDTVFYRKSVLYGGPTAL